jgi:hypothetical protein
MALVLLGVGVALAVAFSGPELKAIDPPVAPQAAEPAR